MIPTAEPLLTALQVAALLNVSPRTVRNWTQAGRLPCIRLTRKAVRYRADVVRTMVSAGTGPPPDARRHPVPAPG